jgi:hypothetical protein
MSEPKESIADALNVSAYDESFAANAGRAAAKLPVVGSANFGKSVAEYAQETGEIDGLGDLAAAGGKLVSDGGKFVASAAADAVGFVFDPIGTLVSAGLDILLELVQPLQDALHQVSGDGPAIGHASSNFVTIAQGFVELASDFEKTGDTALKDWVGDAGDAARAALGDFSVGIRGIGSAAGSVAEVLQMWSMVMVVIEEVIKAIISEFVSWLVTIWAPALASGIISAGASVATAMTLSIQKAVNVFKKVTKHLGVFGKLLNQFVEFLQNFSGKILKIGEHLRVETPAGAKKWVFGGDPAKVAIPGRRTGVDKLGLGEQLGRLGAGIGIKTSLGAGMGAASEVGGELSEDGALLDESQIGGGQGVADTRKNLDI